MHTKYEAIKCCILVAALIFRSRDCSGWEKYIHSYLSCIQCDIKIYKEIWLFEDNCSVLGCSFNYRKM